MKPKDPEIPDPYSKLLDNIDRISPVKRCPKCMKLSLEYNPKTGELYCTECDFRKKLPHRT